MNKEKGAAKWKRIINWQKWDRDKIKQSWIRNVTIKEEKYLVLVKYKKTKNKRYRERENLIKSDKRKKKKGAKNSKIERHSWQKEKQRRTANVRVLSGSRSPSWLSWRGAIFSGGVDSWSRPCFPDPGRSSGTADLQTRNKTYFLC